MLSWKKLKLIFWLEGPSPIRPSKREFESSRSPISHKLLRPNKDPAVAEKSVSDEENSGTSFSSGSDSPISLNKSANEAKKMFGWKFFSVSGQKKSWSWIFFRRFLSDCETSERHSATRACWEKALRTLNRLLLIIGWSALTMKSYMWWNKASN